MTDRQTECAAFSLDATGSEPAAGSPWLGASLAWVLLALVVFSLGLFPLRTSTDEWWHLKTGYWIVQHGFQVPQKDVFTYTAASYDWDNHEWLSEALMYKVWQWGNDAGLGGWRTLIVLKTLLLVATYLLMARFIRQRAGDRRMRGVLIALFVALLAAALGRRMFWPRPPVVSSLFFVFYLYVLWLHRSGRLKTPWLFVLPLLMPLWANLHGGFILGGVVVAAYFGGAAIEWMIGRWGLRRSAEELRPVALRVGVYLVLGILCGLASLLTPFGYRLYLLSARVMQSRELVEVLGELQPPDLRFTWAFVFLTVLLAKGMGVLVGRSLTGRWRIGAGVVLLVGLGLTLWTSASHARALLSRGAGDSVFLCAPPYAFFLLFLGLCSGFLASRLAFPRECDREWPPVADLLIAGFFWWQAAGHLRHLVLFGLAAAPLAAWLLRYWWDKGRFSRLIPPLLVGYSVVMAAWLVFFPGEAVATFAALGAGGGNSAGPRFGPSQFDRNRQILDGLEMEPGAYPTAAVDFIQQARLPGRMFNADNCAGYLIWRLSPERYQVFTDSRFDIFGQDFLSDEQSVCNGWTERFIESRRKRLGDELVGIRPWRQVIEAWNINWLFLEKTELVNCELVRPDSGWALLYLGWRDPFTIWIRRTPENQPWIERYEKRARVEELKALLVAKGVADRAQELGL